MKSIYPLVTLAILALTVPVVVSQSSYKSITLSGIIQYPPEPPQPPSGEYYDIWESDYRVETDFLDYLSGSTFDFNGFFDHLYAKFLQELETTVYGAGYQRPSLDYGSPTYVAGEPILINGSTLESIADYVVYQDENGIVYFRDSSGNVYGDGDKIPNEINEAISATPDNGMVFIKKGTYTLDSNTVIRGTPTYSRTNLIIAGEGWNSTLRLADGVNLTVFLGRSVQNVIVRDIMIDANMAGNPDHTETYGIDFSGTNVLIENLKVLNARRMGIVGRDSYQYFINDVVLSSGWNNMEHIRVSWGAAIGNYLQDARDVGYSTWASDHLVIANNIAVYGIHDGLGYNDANWGIGLETQKGSNPRDTNDIIVRNNIADEHNAASSDEPWKGTGIWVMGSAHASDNAGTYNVIVDGNTMRNNNRAGLVVLADTLYSYLSNTVVVVNNFASGNDIYNKDGGNYGNYVIQRSGIIFENNVEE